MTKTNNSTNVSNKYGFVIFLGIFITIYCLMNYYVLSSYYDFFNFEKNDIFFILLFILTSSYIISVTLESVSDNRFSKLLYLISSIWLGTSFISLFTVSIFNIINIFRISSWNNYLLSSFMLGIYSIILTLIIVIYSIYNNFSINVKEFNIYNSKNASARIVHLSDIHLGPVYDKNRLSTIVKKINTLSPDVVLITGDMLDGRYVYDKDILTPLNSINCDVYFVCGNHDVYAGLNNVQELLSKTKVKWLRDEVAYFKKEKTFGNVVNVLGNIDIVGVDDNYDLRQLEATIYSLKMNGKLNNNFTLLMAHRPVGWLNASKYVDLMICGHTHAGQIWPFTYLTYIHNGASKGIYRSYLNNKFMLYVNSGVGTWGPPMRLGTRPEIVVFNIVRESITRRSEHN